MIGGRNKLGAGALARLIRWAASADNFSLMFDRLAELGENDPLKLNAALGIAGIKRALKQWTENRHTATTARTPQAFETRDVL